MWPPPHLRAMWIGREDGAQDRNRTDNHLLTRQTLSQLSYLGVRRVCVSGHRSFRHLEPVAPFGTASELSRSSSHREWEAFTDVTFETRRNGCADRI